LDYKNVEIGLVTIGNR